MPLRVRFQAAMPPEAPLPMTMTGWTFGGDDLHGRILTLARPKSKAQGRVVNSQLPTPNVRRARSPKPKAESPERKVSCSSSE